MAGTDDLARRRRALDALRTWRFGRPAHRPRPRARGQEGHARHLSGLDRDVQERHRVRFREARARSEEHTSELQSLMRISYAVFCLKKKKNTKQNTEREITLKTT